MSNAHAEQRKKYTSVTKIVTAHLRVQMLNEVQTSNYMFKFIFGNVNFALSTLGSKILLSYTQRQ